MSEISESQSDSDVRDLPSHLDGINHSGDEHGEDDVTVEVAPLCYGARHYGGTGRSEGALKHDGTHSSLIPADKVLTWKKKKANFSGSRSIRTKFE